MDSDTKKQFGFGILLFVVIGVIVFWYRNPRKIHSSRIFTNVVNFPDFARFVKYQNTYVKWMVAPGPNWTMSFDLRVQGEGESQNIFYVFLDDKQSLDPPKRDELGKFHGAYYQLGAQQMTLVHDGKAQSRWIRQLVDGDWHQVVINHTPDRMDIQVDHKSILSMNVPSDQVQVIKSIGLGSWTENVQFDVRAFQFSSSNVSITQKDFSADPK